MNESYKLKYEILDDKQIKEFACGITAETINLYLEEHQDEYIDWKQNEDIKVIVKRALKSKNLKIQDKIRMLEEMRKSYGKRD